MSSAEILALRKQGQSAKALEMARAEHPKNAADIWFLRAYAWALYDHVKSLVERYEAKQLSPTVLSSQLSPLMREFAQIGEPLRGDSAFSQMLRMAGKAAKGWSEFLGFACWVGTDDFSDEDKKPFINEKGKTIDSLQTRFLRAICRETVTSEADAQANPEWVEWGKGILQQALLANPNDQWINYYQSKLHMAHGETDQAVKRLTLVLHRQSRAAWPWALLGEILEPKQPDDALICYTHATQLAREEQEVAKVRIHLAQRLALTGRFHEAAQQAHLASKYREQHGFKVPPDLQQLLASDWYQQAVANGSLQQLPKVEAEARALLQGLDRQNLTFTRGVIDHVNAEKALSYVATGADTGFGLPHRKFPKLAALLPGTVVEIGRAAPEGPPLDWRISDVEVLPGLCETLSGTLARHESRGFDFIQTTGEDIFVHPDLAKAFTPGQTYDVSCVAIKRTNKQGKTGWRAVKFIKSEGPLPSVTT